MLWCTIFEKYIFCLTLGNQHFGSKQHVNQTIFEKKVCIGYSNDSRQLLMPKETLDYYRFFSRKLVWFGITRVLLPKIDLWGIFPTQFLSLNTNFHSELRNGHKHGIFRKFRKAGLKLVIFQLHCPKINCFHSKVRYYCGYRVGFGFWPFLKF